MKNKIIITIFIFFTLISNANAFGVASGVYEDRPLTMDIGETKIVNFNIQNMVGEEDVFVQATLTTGHTIAELQEDFFEVKFGTHDTMAPLEVKIPRDAKPGSITKVRVEFNSVTPGQSGGIALGTGMAFGFDVIISGETAPRNVPWVLIVISLVIIILIIIILIVLKKRKAKQENRLRSSTNFK